MANSRREGKVVSFVRCAACDHNVVHHTDVGCTAPKFDGDATVLCGCPRFKTYQESSRALYEPKSKPNGTALKKPFTVPGVGADAPKTVNDDGGEQSFVPYRFDLIDERALFALARILDYGARERGYGEHNWRLIPVNENINHCLIHIFAFLAGDTQDDHLEHAFTRLHFAVGVYLASKTTP